MMGLWKGLICLYIFFGGNSVTGKGTDWSRLDVQAVKVVSPLGLS